MKKGLTLIELMITIVMFVALAASTFYVFRAVLLSWSSQEDRSGVNINLDWRMEEIVRDLREAKQVQSVTGYDEIRFTLDNSAFYIYYFYNSSDSYVPPPAFNQSSYELRRAALTGGINGTFTYGNGRLMLTDLLPPTTSDLSLGSNLITIDLSITRGDETIRSRTQVRPRNL